MVHEYGATVFKILKGVVGKLAFGGIETVVGNEDDMCVLTMEVQENWRSLNYISWSDFMGVQELSRTLRALYTT